MLNLILIDCIGCETIVGVKHATNMIILQKPGASKEEVPKNFSYDAVYSIDSNQQEVYDDCGFPLVESVLEGYNGMLLPINANTSSIWFPLNNLFPFLFLKLNANTLQVLSLPMDKLDVERLIQ
jgi:hypothetical protein